MRAHPCSQHAPRSFDATHTPSLHTESSFDARVARRNHTTPKHDHKERGRRCRDQPRGEKSAKNKTRASSAIQICGNRPARKRSRSPTRAGPVSSTLGQHFAPQQSFLRTLRASESTAVMHRTTKCHGAFPRKFGAGASSVLISHCQG